MTHRATTQAIERRVRREHGPLLDRLEACADAVVDDWPSQTASDREAVVDPLRSELENAQLLQVFPMLLTDLVRSTGYGLSARPVANPPYVVVTSRGPILRATIDPGRLVVRFDCFSLERDPGPVYRQLESVTVTAEIR